MSARRMVLMVAVVAMIAATAACTPRDTARDACLGGDRPIMTTPPVNTTRWPSSSLLIPSGTTIDARGATFENSVFDVNGYAIAIKIHTVPGTRENLCVVGGTLFSTLDPENTLWNSWHRHVGMIIDQPDFQLVGTSFRNQGDMISFAGGASNWKMIGVRADGDGVLPHGYIHDDCIENDAMNGGLVDDSKLDGCNVFLSSIGGGDGGANTVEVRDSLVRLRPFHESFNPPKYGYDQTGGFFKWAEVGGTGGTPPQLVVRDTVFRADQPGAYGGNVNGFLGLPPGTVCDNVTLVGTATWRASDLASWTSQCTNLTLGTTADWDAAVADWDAAHPAL